MATNVRALTQNKTDNVLIQNNNYEEKFQVAAIFYLSILGFIFTMSKRNSKSTFIIYN